MRPLALGLAVAAALPGAALAQGVERGHELAVRWCADCHVVAPGEPGGDAGPAFATLLATRTAPGLRAWLFQPHPPMPDLQLSADEIDALLAYIHSLGD